MTVLGHGSHYAGVEMITEEDRITSPGNISSSQLGLLLKEVYVLQYLFCEFFFLMHLFSFQLPHTHLPEKCILIDQ